VRTRSPLAIVVLLALALGLAAAPAACSIKRVIFLSDDAGTAISPDDAGFDAGGGDDAAAPDAADDGPPNAVDATDATDAMEGSDAADGGVPDGCASTGCQPVCGNNLVEPGEQCDDGNTINGDTCEADCTLPRCGNSILDPNEQCDFGTETVTCNANCTQSVCGDGIVNRVAGETCDDGNPFSETCSSTCQAIGCAGNDLVPAMSSPTLPSGIVDRSGIYDPSSEAWQAFDGNNATMWISALDETPAWISYEWQDGPHIIVSYAITSAEGAPAETAPSEWTFEGWDDVMGIWLVLDSRSAEVVWHQLERRTYLVTSSGSFSRYRLVFTDDNDATPGVLTIAVAGIELMGCPGPVPAP
jgi:cysteine-rich repeat protein